MFDLPTLLPPNAQKVEYDLEQLSARLQGMADPVQGLWDAAICPEHLLPYLAWAFSVEVWEASWPESYRRQVLVDAVQVHRRKGTVGSVRRALGGIGFRTDISEWFEHGGDPHTFRIDAYGEDVFAAGFQINPALLQLVTLILIHVKPERSHFELRIGETFENDAYLRAGVNQAHVHRLDLDPAPRVHEAEGAIYARATHRIRCRYTHEHIPAARAAKADATSFTRSGHRARVTSRITHDFQVREGAAYAV